VITKLTESQLSRMSDYRDRWLAIGLATGPLDLDAAKRAIIDAYAVAKMPAPAVWITLPSPIHGAIGATLLAQVRNRVWNQVWNQVRAQARAQARAQVWDQVWDQVRAQVRDHVWAQVWNQVGAQVWDQVWNQVGDQVRNQVRAQVWDHVGDQVSRCGYGSHDAAWLAFCEFFGRECGLDATSGLEPLSRLASVAGWWWPFAHACIITPRPSAILRNPAHQLHADGRMALAYGDAWGIWALNGVRMPQWIVEPPAGQLDPRKLTTIGNAEIRREFVRKVGIDRICYKLGANVTDKQGAYELLRLDVGGGRIWSYLKMLNPSIGTWHVEGVPNEIQTVQEALNWRNHLTPDMIDDDSGAEWVQQGDVILRPRGAKKFKSQPAVLT
jgi:hypothetical protein